MNKYIVKSTQGEMPVLAYSMMIIESGDLVFTDINGGVFAAFGAGNWIVAEKINEA